MNCKNCRHSAVYHEHWILHLGDIGKCLARGCSCTKFELWKPKEAKI